MRVLKAVIFDMDGVLFDSTKYNHASFNKVLGKYGIQLSQGEYGKISGMSFRDKISYVQQRTSARLPPLMELSRESVAMQLSLLKADLANTPNSRPLVEELKKAGVKVAIGTASMRYRAELFLDLLGIRCLFDALVSADEVQEHKPSPAIFLETAKLLNVHPAECIVIEDTPIGIAAAKAGNMKVVGVVTQYHPAPELSQADLIINSLPELSVPTLKSLFA